MASPIYLFTGPEFGEKNDKIDSIKTDLKKKFGEVDFYKWYASEDSVSKVISQLQSGSLFASASCVIYREAELLKKKEDLEMLENWINSNSENVLILITDDISVDSKLDKLIPSNNKKIFWGLDESRKEEWIRNFFRKNNSFISLGIEDDAVDLILDMVENDTASLRSECSRFLFCFNENHIITIDDVEKILSHNREEDTFTLFESMTDLNYGPSKRLEVALSIVQQIMLTKASNPISIISGLAFCFRKLSLWHTIHAGSSYVDDFTLKKNGFTSKKMREQYSRAAKIWNFGQSASIISHLSTRDIEIRSLGTALQNTQLFMLIYEIIMKNGVSYAKYENDFII